MWALLELPPLAGRSAEGVAGTPLRILAALGALIYGISAIRYLVVYRGKMGLLPASIVACLTLVGEALLVSALVGERTWHASWWEWHTLIVTAYAIVLFAARNQWRQERFHQLYLPTTRERMQEVSVLFADLVAFTTLAEQSSSSEVATMLSRFYGMATPLISERLGDHPQSSSGTSARAVLDVLHEHRLGRKTEHHGLPRAGREHTRPPMAYQRHDTEAVRCPVGT